MTSATIQKTIARCIKLQRLEAKVAAELKVHKAALFVEAESDPKAHTPTDGGGWSWVHQDAVGNIARVTQPGDKLKGKLDPEAKTFAKIKETAGRAFMNLFMQIPAYKPVEDFREKAHAHLPKDSAKKLIKLVTTDSDPTVNFEVAKKGDA